MPTLLLVRHATAEPPGPEGDHARPLSPSGRAEAARLGRFLREAGVRPRGVLVSSARRTRETFALAGEAGAWPGEDALGPALRITDALYEASPQGLLHEADAAGPPSPLVLVAHEPALSRLVERLTEARVLFPPGTLACIATGSDVWAEAHPGTSRLAWLVPPSALPA